MGENKTKKRSLKKKKKFSVRLPEKPEKKGDFCFFQDCIRTGDKNKNKTKKELAFSRSEANLILGEGLK
jgi:hypothetical protein